MNRGKSVLSQPRPHASIDAARRSIGFTKAKECRGGNLTKFQRPGELFAPRDTPRREFLRRVPGRRCGTVRHVSHIPCDGQSNSRQCKDRVGGVCGREARVADFRRTGSA